MQPMGGVWAAAGVRRVSTTSLSKQSHSITVLGRVWLNEVRENSPAARAGSKQVTSLSKPTENRSRKILAWRVLSPKNGTHPLR